MEREILIANTKTQKRSKINSSATTLGELKAELRAANIDYSNMTFTEGISKTQLLDDATQLPQNVMYKGQPTNNLVILLTNTKKNIASGASSRKEAYALIKENGLQDVVKAKFGRNFTQVPTEDLLELLAEHDIQEEDAPEEKPMEEPNEEPQDKALPDCGKDNGNDNSYTLEDFLTDTRILTVGDSISYHIAMLANEGVLEAHDIKGLQDDLSHILSLLGARHKVESEPVSTSDGIDDDDIDDMINDIL